MQATNDIQVREVAVKLMQDADPDPSYLDQEGFEDRLAAYNRDEFHFVGVRAEAEIVVEGIIQTITSGGLWGIESDSDDDYLRSVGDEELDQLRSILQAMGVPDDLDTTAVDPMPREYV